MQKKVVLIQDDFHCGEIMRYLLEDEGYAVLISNMQEVLSNPPDFDLLIVDEFSEFKTGCEICKELKRNETTASKPIVFTSTCAHIELKAKECYADSYMAKPFDINHFSTIVNCLCSGERHSADY
jgi:DNA-binding response OmpR family regulator